MVVHATGESTTEAIPLVSVIPYHSLVASSAQETFCLVSVRGPGQTEGKRRPLHVSCVIDKSGSMSGKKMDTLKATLKFMVEALSPADRLALVSYSGTAKLDMALQSLNQGGRATALASIARVKPGGATNLDGGLQLGLQALLDADDDKRFVNAAVLLFTDGFANAGVTDPSSMVAAMHSKVAELDGYGTVSLYTFGFQDHDTGLLFTLANEQRGCYYNIKDTAAIPVAFADCLGGLMSIVAQNANLQIRALGGVTLRCVHTRFPVAPIHLRRAPKDDEDVYNSNSSSSTSGVYEESKGESTNAEATISNRSSEREVVDIVAKVSLGDFILKEQRDILVTLSLPAQRPEVALECELVFADAMSGQLQRRTCILPLITGEEGKMNLEVESHRLRLLVAEALDCTQTDNPAEAQARLQSMIALIYGSPAKELPMCQSLAEDLKKCMGSLGNGETVGWKAEEVARGYRALNDSQKNMMTMAQDAIRGAGGSSVLSSFTSVSSSSNASGEVKSGTRHNDRATVHTSSAATAASATYSVNTTSKTPNMVYVDAANVRVGNLVIENNTVVRVVQLTRSKSGKHGHAKFYFNFMNPIDGKKSQAIYPTSVDMPIAQERIGVKYVPHNGVVHEVWRFEVQVADVDSDRWVTFIDEEGEVHTRALKLSDNPFGTDVMERYGRGEPIKLSVFQTSSGEVVSLVVPKSVDVTPPPGAASRTSVVSVSFGSVSGVLVPPASLGVALTSVVDTLGGPTSDIVGAPGGPSF